MRLTEAQAAALGRRQQQPTREAGELLAVFVPGPVRNPLNGTHGHWSKRAKWAKGWREKTTMVILEGYGLGYTGIVHEGTSVAAWRPKTVTFTANTHNRMDDDNLRAALKPVRDGLKDMRVIDDDKPESGHEFVYHQRIDRARRGVEIRVRVRAAPAAGRPVETLRRNGPCA